MHWKLTKGLVARLGPQAVFGRRSCFLSSRERDTSFLLRKTAKTSLPFFSIHSSSFSSTTPSAFASGKSDMSLPPTVPAPGLPIEEGGVFGVRRVYCVAKNYAAHTIEMGGDPKTDPPCFFAKPSDAACNVDKVPYPPMTQNLHHEIEQVFSDILLSLCLCLSL